MTDIDDQLAEFTQEELDAVLRQPQQGKSLDDLSPGIKRRALRRLTETE